MESAIAWALEDKLGYWIKSFSREQLRLRGRTARLSNVEINGDALHAGLGLPPAFAVAAARIQELVITLPSILNMQVEPTVVNIDKLDIVLEEKDEMEHHSIPNSNLTSPSSTKDSGHGYADKIADGMTVKVGTMNLQMKTHGAAPCEGGIPGSTPLGAITVHDLMLYTTNEKWQVVSLKEARNFSDDRELIYVFKKMEWQSLTVDLKPHANNSADMQLNYSIGQYNAQDGGGAIRIPYIGERILEGKSGEANITIQRTEQKDLLGLEFQVHIIEAHSPALSEHGLLVLLSFITSLRVVLSKRVADPGKKHLEAARSFSVSVMVDHINLCIKDIELQLELLMKSLFFSRASAPDGDNCKILSCIKVGELVLRDTFVKPLCTLIEPSKQVVRRESSPVPDIGQSFGSIYPFGNQLLDSTNGYPLLSVYSLQITPSPLPPKFSVETVITCNPVMMFFQEQSCLRIASILANGVVKNFYGAMSPESAVHSLTFSVQEFELSSVLTPEEISRWHIPESSCSQSFSVARIHVENLYFCLSPSANCNLLSLEKDPTCSILWEHQSIHASKRKWVTRASYVTLETFNTLEELDKVNKEFGNRRGCIIIEHPVIEVAMATADGSPLTREPPPECFVRISIHFHHYISSVMVNELFFLLALFAYFGQLLKQISNLNRNNLSETSRESLDEKLAKEWPSNIVMNFSLDNLALYIKETSPVYSRLSQLLHLGGSIMFLKVSHRTVGSTLEVTTSLQWNEITVHCSNLERPSDHEGGIGSVGGIDIFVEEEEIMKNLPMFRVDSQSNYQDNRAQFLDITIDYKTSYGAQDVECCKLKFAAKISGVRLGGGMRYTESLLQRLGIELDGCPGKDLLKGIINSFSGPLAKLLILKSFTEKDDGSTKEDNKSEFGSGMSYGIDVSVELRDWIFALEGTEGIGDWTCRRTGNLVPREVKFWQAAIRSLHLRGKHSSQSKLKSAEKASQKTEYPFEYFMARVEGLQAIRPHLRNPATGNGTTQGHQTGSALASTNQGTDVEATMFTSSEGNRGVSKWTMDKTRFSLEDLVTGAAATKEEQEYLSTLCRSEADSLGRIATVVLRLLELDGSLAQAAINQLASLGSGLEEIFTPEMFSTK